MAACTSGTAILASSAASPGCSTISSTSGRVKKSVILTIWIALVGAGIYFAVTRLPQGDLEPIVVSHPPATPGPGRTDSTRAAAPAAPIATAPISDLSPRASDATACVTGCGKERWAEKTLADPARDSIDFAHVHDVTIAQLAAMSTEPDRVVLGWRRAPIELTVYRVTGWLVGVLGENDHDVHLILADSADGQTTMIAEIPDPNCEGACMSGFASRYAAARELVAQHFSSQKVLVRVTGVGFIDFNHGQAGAAPNQFELHPVLRLEFMR